MSNINEKIKKNRLLFLVGLIYVGLFIIAPEKAIKSVNNSVYYLIEMLQVLPVIFLLTVIIEAWVPKEVIIKRFGDKSGFTGNLLSLLLGSISAGPIYAAFPVSKMLIKKGASITNVVIILSAWAVIKVPMLANEAKFLGAGFMAVRWILTVIAIFIMAYLVSVIVKKKDLPDDKIKGEILQIKQEYCIGCGICAKLVPDFYEMNDNKAKVKQQPMGEDYSNKIQISVEKCPAKAILYHESEGESI